MTRRDTENGRTPRPRPGPTSTYRLSRQPVRPETPAVIDAVTLLLYEDGAKEDAASGCTPGGWVKDARTGVTPWLRPRRTSSRPISVPGMHRTVYRTTTSLDGFIADADQSLGWLFAVDHDGPDGHEEFLRDVGVIVEGSSTYEWVLRETDLLARPELWEQYYGSRPTYVFTTRDLPTPAGADVRFRQGPVTEHLKEIRHAASSAVTVGSGRRRPCWAVPGHRRTRRNRPDGGACRPRRWGSGASATSGIRSAHPDRGDPPRPIC